MQVPATVTLSKRETAFVAGMCLYGRRPSRAALEAGYRSPNMGRQLMLKQHVRAAILQCQKNADASVELMRSNYPMRPRDHGLVVDDSEAFDPEDEEGGDDAGA